MLGGTAPVILFNFASISSKTLLEKMGIKIGEDSLFNFDIPFFSIPVYLDEQLTGLLVDDHERSINIEYETDGINNYEREISSDVTITIIAQKNNVALQAFLALFEKVLKYVNEKAYKIYFYYDDIFLTDAGLKDFNVSTRPNTDTRVVKFTLTNRSDKSKAREFILKDVTDSLKDNPK